MDDISLSPDRHASGDARSVLDVVRASARQLLEDFPHPPTALRIRVGDVTLEAEWTPPAVAPSAGATGSTTPGAAGVTVALPEAPPDERHLVTAATVGCFYAAPSPGAPPFVAVGDAVVAGQQLAIVESMKLMIPVQADVDATVVEVLCTTGDTVHYGDPLVVLAPIG